LLNEVALSDVTLLGVTQAGQPPKRKTYDVDGEADAFYSRYKGAPFPDAIAANGSELEAVSQREEDIRRRTGAAGISLDSSTAAAAAAAAASVRVCVHACTIS
jgi:sec1 family domain-containing protein 1